MTEILQFKLYKTCNVHFYNLPATTHVWDYTQSTQLYVHVYTYKQLHLLLHKVRIQFQPLTQVPDSDVSELIHLSIEQSERTRPLWSGGNHASRRPGSEGLSRRAAVSGRGTLRGAYG